MEWRSGCLNTRSVDAHGVERLGVQDVEAAASIHQYFGETLCVDDRVDHKQISSWLQDAFLGGQSDQRLWQTPTIEGR